MRTLRVYDTQAGVLTFDLDVLVDLIQPFATETPWQVAAVVDGDVRYFEAHGRGAAALEALERSGSTIDGDALASFARETDQVIWGMFTAYASKGAASAWVTIRAIDSTFFEISTLDERVLSAVVSRFTDVREFETPWTSPTI